MAIKAQAQGKTFTFPDGTSPQAMGDAIDEFFSQQQPSVDDQQTVSQPLSSRERRQRSRQRIPDQRIRDLSQQVQAGQISAQDLPVQDVRAIQQRRLQQLPELAETGVKPLADTEGLEGFASTLAAASTLNPQEMANIISSRFPQIGVTQTPDNQFILVNNETGQAVNVNRPGISPADILQGIGLIGLFSPAGRAGAGVASLGGRAAAVGGGSALTETGLQIGQAAAGGEFDPEEVALSGALGAGGQAIGEAVISPAVRAISGRISPEAQQIIRQGEQQGVDVLTSDVLPPETNITKTLQQLSEKLGPLGTGNVRQKQQQARQAIIEELGADLSIESEPVLANIVSSLNRGVAKSLERGAMQKGEGIFRLAPMGDVPVGRVNEVIERQIASERSLQGVANQQTITRLNNYRESIQNANFRQLDRIRSRILADIRDARGGDSLPTTAEAPLQAVKSSLDDAMKSFAGRTDRTALSLWLKGNRSFFETFGKARRSVLKQAIKEGEMKPETLGRIIKQGQTSDLKRLNSLLDDSGKKSVQAAIIRDALEESGFFGAGANPDRFINAIQKGPRKRAINVFFKGAERNQIEGIERLLDATRRAQQAAAAPATGQQVVSGGILVGGGAGLATNPVATILGAGTLAGITKAYESKAVRNMLLKLANTPKGSKAEQDIIENILPNVISTLQATTEQETN